MIRLIASDLDGTLLHNGAQQLTPRTIELIHALTRKGVHFIAASGRQYDNERRLFAPIKDEISYIAENGSLCIHRGEVIKPGLRDRRLQGGHLPDRGPLSGICKPYRKCHEKHDRDRR